MPFESKADYEKKLFEILDPVSHHYTENNTRIVLGYTGASYPPDIANIESYLRVLWGFAPYLHGGGSNGDLENIYLQGFSKGTNPKDPNYWGTPNDYSQLFVEMAAISVSILLAPEKLWNPLSAEAKQNVANWLGTINSRQIWVTNWQFFAVLVNTALLKVGSDQFSQEVLNRSLNNINSIYVGNGWYTDDYPRDSFDYYNAFAFHYYGLIYSVFMKEHDPINSQLFRERAILFGQQFMLWFDESGAAIPFGRSLTYRFAQVAFFSACVYAGVEPLSLAAMKGLIERNLDYWWQSHMKDYSGLLTIGYSYPDLVMSESYNAPGSPLWALKTFLILALPDDHPYWSLSAEEFPRINEIKVLPDAKMIVSNSSKSATLYPCGSYDISYPEGHFAEKYAKFAYSTKYGFSIRKENVGISSMAPDSDLVFEIGGIYLGRNAPTSVEISDQTITSRWSPFPGIDVTTVITPSEYGHSRQHTIVSSLQCTAYDCGFSFPLDYDNFSSETDNNTALVKSDFGSVIVYLYDLNNSGLKTNGTIIEASPNSNLVFSRTVIPAISFDIKVGTTNVMTSVIVQ